MSAPNTRRWVIIIVKGTVTISLIWFVLSEIDLSESLHQLHGLSFKGVAGFLLLLALQALIGVWRWTFVIKLFGQPLPFFAALRLYFEGLFFNQALPSTIGGDAVRMYRCTRIGMPVGAAINGVLLDRVGGVGGLLILVGFCQPLAWQRLHELGPRIAFAFILMAGITAIAVLIAMASLPKHWCRWRFVEGIVELSSGARRMCLSPAIIIPVIGLAMAVHIITVLAVYILARDLELPITFWDCLVLIPLVFLVATIPVSIAGWGVREGAMVTALGLLGVSASGAVSVSILFGFGLLAIGLIGGVAWLTQGDRRIIGANEIDRLKSATRTESV